ncbi:MAG: hypothetical protein KAS32_14800 [Candidatus Peribacteraceae bacterium]|nr:hypothetical protein [Candidatus Peribacteraceae bacterium]
MSSFVDCVKKNDDGSCEGLTYVVKDGKTKKGRKIFRKGTPEQNKKAAQDWVHMWERIRAGLSATVVIPMNLGDLIETYIEGVRGDVKPITLDSYRRLLSPILNHFGPPHSFYFNQFEIDQYVQKRRTYGAGRTIIKELSVLRYALAFVYTDADWIIPKKLYRIPKKESYVPTVAEYKKLVAALSPNAALAVSMALLAGLRDEEVYRVRWEHYSPSERLLSIPASIRKTNKGNVVPVVDTLEFLLGAASPGARRSTIIPCCKTVINPELVRVSSEVGIPKWAGLQPARRLFCTLAEDAGWGSDQIALITGHVRTSMVSRYSAANGRLELKRQILEDVERMVGE